MSRIVKTPKTPYYSVIFTSKRTDGDNGYSIVADKMMSEAEKIDGFIGAESLRDESGFGMTISYWESLDSINDWRNHIGHMEAKLKGKELWYSEYKLRICKVEIDNYFKTPK